MIEVEPTESKKLRKILRTCEARLGENKNDLDALFSRAAALAIFGNLKESKKSLDELLILNPEYPGAWRFLSRIYRELSQCGEDN